MVRGKEKQHAHMEAINAFKRAWGLKRGILACKGLVKAFLKDGNAGQAKGFARDARTNMPDSADSWVLLGTVYAHLGQRDKRINSTNDNFEKAKRAFRKALTLDPLSMDATYQTVNVLADPEMRSGIKTFSNWPTIPQLYVGGKFIGGCDIAMEMHRKGELKSVLENIV